MNKLIEERGSRTKLKFLMESCWKLESIITDLHEQPMEKLAPNDSLFNDDWIAEVSITLGECSIEVSEYL